jgi:hypothetical protein
MIAILVAALAARGPRTPEPDPTEPLVVRSATVCPSGVEAGSGLDGLTPSSVP